MTIREPQLPRPELSPDEIAQRMRDAAANAGQVMGDHEVIEPVAHNGEPVTQVPGFIRQESADGTVTDVPLHTVADELQSRGVPASPAALTEQVEPFGSRPGTPKPPFTSTARHEAADQPRRRISRKAIGLGTAAAVLVGGGVVTAIELSGHGKKGAAPVAARTGESGNRPTPNASQVAVAPGPSDVPKVSKSASPESPATQSNPFEQLEKEYPVVTPDFNPSDTGDAAAQLLRDLNMYYLTGNESYLDAALPKGVATKAMRNQAAGDRQYIQEQLTSLSPADYQKAIQKEAEDFIFESTSDIGHNSDFFELDITTSEYQPGNLRFNKTGKTQVVRQVTIGKYTDKQGNHKFYLVNSDTKSSTAQ